MARKAEDLIKVVAPETLPEGCEVIQAERTLSGVDAGKDATGKANPKPSAVVSVIVPQEGNAAGLRNWVKMRSEMAKAAGIKDEKGNVIEDMGVQDAVNAIRDAAFNIVPKLTLESVKESKSLFLPVSGPRTIDPFEAATAKVASFAREKGRMPTAEELGAIYAGLV